MDIGEEDVLLGLDWFQAAEPKVLSWKEGAWRHPLQRQDLKLAGGPKQTRRVVTEAKVAFILAKPDPDAPTPEVVNWVRPEEEEVDSSEPEPFTLRPEYEDFRDVFDVEAAGKLAPLTGRTHAIEVEEGKLPPWGPIYSLSDKELRVLREYIAEAQAKGWIRRSISPAGAPILFVPKKGGQLRLCVDYRGLNKVTRKNKAPLPLISEILDRLQGAKLYSKFDLKDAYHRLRIREGDEWKTAFRCRYGHFEYQVMPFGLVNAPATFQEYINDALGDLVDTVCIVYLDDILVYSKDPADHEQAVRSVLQRLRDAGLYANPSKCEFHVESVRFLGFVVSEAGIEMEPERVVSIAQWPLPSSVHDIQIFLGFTGFYRRFIKGYSKEAAPLTDLLQGAGTWDRVKLGNKEVAAFEKLKSKFLDAPILMHFDPSASIRLETDASGYAIGAVLAQKKLDRWHPVAYYSRKLRGAELNYTTPDSELLAISEAFRVWRHYVAYAEEEVLVITDHLNHRWLADKPKLNSRQTYALDMLMPFHFRIEYRPGKENPADGLSRRPDYFDGEKKREGAALIPLFLQKFAAASPVERGGGVSRSTGRGPNPRPSRQDAGDEPQDSLGGPLIGKISTAYQQVVCPQLATCVVTALKLGTTTAQSSVATADRLTVPLEESLRALQQGDAFACKIRDALAGSQNPEAGSRLDSRWREVEGLLCFNTAAYVPEGLRAEVLRLIHDDPAAGHQGTSKTLRRARLQFFWPQIRKDIKRYVSECLLCQQMKPRLHRPYGELAPLPVPSRPFQEISMDFVTGLPPVQVGSKTLDAILVIVDRFSKYVIYVPISKSITSDGLASLFLDRIFKDYGIPEGIVTDRGSVFTSSFWRSFCHLLACKRLLSTAFHPQTDGQTERMNQLLEHYLRTFCCEEQTDWEEKLYLAQFTVNTSLHSSTGESPAEVLRGYTPRAPYHVTTPLSLMNDLAETRAVELRKRHAATVQVLRKTQEYHKKWYDRNRIPKAFEAGDWVLLSTKNLNFKRPSKKLSAKYLGPFRVQAAIGNHKLAYRLELPTSVRAHNVFPISSLEPYRGSEPPATVPQVPFEDEGHFEVERFLEAKGRGYGRRYLVKWRGYPGSENTWVPRSHFDDPECPQQYEDELRANKQRTPSENAAQGMRISGA